MVFNESVARHAAQEPQHHGVPHGGHSEHHAKHVQRPIPYQKAGTLRQKPPRVTPGSAAPTRYAQASIGPSTCA